MGTEPAPCGWYAAVSGFRAAPPSIPPTRRESADAGAAESPRAERLPREPGGQDHTASTPGGRPIRGATPALPARRHRQPAGEAGGRPAPSVLACASSRPFPAPDEGDGVNSPTPAPLMAPDDARWMFTLVRGRDDHGDTVAIEHTHRGNPGGKDHHSQALAPGRGPRSRGADLVGGGLREPPDGRHSYRRAFREAAGEITRPRDGAHGRHRPLAPRSNPDGTCCRAAGAPTSRGTRADSSPERPRS